MPADHKDYSATPLWRKLGIAEGARVHVASAPDDLDLAALAPLPAGVRFLARPGRDLDVVLSFETRLVDLARRFPKLAATIGQAGRLWIAWPTKAAGLRTDLDFAAVQTVGLAAGLVDNKSASITAAYQGLQFVIRVKDRAR